MKCTAIVSNKSFNLTGADLGKVLTDLLQNERSKRKLLGGEIFSIKLPKVLFPGFLSKSDNLQFTFIKNIDISIFYHENSDRFP